MVHLSQLSRISPGLLLLCVSFFPFGCASSRSSQLQGAEYYFEEGMKDLEKKRCLEAIEKFQRLISNFPGSPRISDAQYYLAESYFCNQDYVNAIFEYQRLIDTYPSSQWVDEAQFKIGESHFRQLRRPELDQKETYEALNYFRYFLEDNPDSPLAKTAYQRIAECRNRLAQKQYLVGHLYQRQGYLEAATMAYEEVIRNYSDTPWYYRTLLRLGEIASAQQDYVQARGYWEEVLQDCGEVKLQQEAKKKLEKLQNGQRE